MKKKDLLLIGILLLLSLLPTAYFFADGTLSRTGRTYAVIQVDGKEYKTVPLDTHRGTTLITVKTSAGYNTIAVQDESIGVVEADCADHICIDEGFISRPGQTVVCLPHKVLIEVRSDDGDEPDIIRAR